MIRAHKTNQNDLEAILIGSIIPEIFDLENAPKLLTLPSQHLFDIFCEIQNATTQGGSPDPLDSRVIFILSYTLVLQN